MRADYLDRFGPEFKGGFKTLLEKSKIYTQANLDHIPTETAPGHATIITGRPPGDNGIIGNDWFDRDSGKMVLAIDDPNLGVGPAKLMAKTLGDVLKEQKPGAHVVALSYKDRAAVMLGGKHSDASVWFDKKSKKFTAIGSSTSWVNNFNAKNSYANLQEASFATDQATFDISKAAINEFHLGEDDTCDLLAISFSATDLIGHKVGPDNPQMRAQLLALDALLGDLLTLLAQKTNNNFVLALTSDHGVLPIPESANGKTLDAKRIFQPMLQQQLEASCQRLFPASSNWVVSMPFPDVYLNRDLLKARRLDWGDFLIKVATEWKKIPDVAMVYLNNPLIPQDKYSLMYQRSNVPGRSGDLSIRMRPGVLVSPRLGGTSHGSPYEYDTHVPLLFYGTGIAQEKVEKPTSNEIIAWTFAQIIGLDFF